MAQYKTIGIILARVNYAEADRILTILTSDHGKISGLAKAVRKPASKLGPHLELFSKIDLMLATGRNLDIITSARAVETYRNLAADLEKLGRAFLFCEMANKLTTHHTSAKVFDLLDSGLASLDQGLSPYLTELWFKLRLLDELGYRPNLAQCMKSRAEIIAGKRYVFSASSGGVIEARYAGPEDPPIGDDHIKLWRVLQTFPLVKVAKLGGADKAATESLPVANDFYDYLFGKRFKSSEI